jgi:hypothetical protein
VSRGVGNGAKFLRGFPRPAGLLLLCLRKVFGFGPLRLSSGPGLRCWCVDWTFGRGRIEACSALHTTFKSALMSWLLDCTSLCGSSLQVGSCALAVGRNVEMWGFLANGQHCAINCWGGFSLGLMTGC